MSEIGAGVLLGLEIIKFVTTERRLQELAARAGVSPEQLDAELGEARVRFKALDPHKLPEA